MSIHVVLVHPEIHWNTGNAGRTCLAVGATLHLVQPLGFSLDEKQVRRAGLDYWEHVDLRLWPDWPTFEAALPQLGEPYFFSTKARRAFWDAPLDATTDVVLVFGRETGGLAPEIHERYADRFVGLPILSPHVRSLNLSSTVAIATTRSFAGSMPRCEAIQPGHSFTQVWFDSQIGPTEGATLDEKALFTGFWTHESKTTRNVLARIPEGSDDRPDPKSRTAHEIAWQIVCEEKMIIEAIETGRAAWAPPPMPATMQEVLYAHERQSAGIEARWNSLPEARWNGSLEFFGTERAASPMAWSFLFDIVQHRGQISTYLRPMGSTVPQIYGPSGDEP